jgi:hypothetical protein
MQMPGRHGNTGDYRYGYQGSEKDGEISGEGNSYSTFFRQLDVRLGRWKSIDPKVHAWESPYVSMGDNPIRNNDVLGDEIDISDIVAYGHWDVLKTDLQSKTGLILTVVNGKMIYEKVQRKNRTGRISRLARRKLMNAIDDEATVTVIDYYGMGGSEVEEDGKTILWDELAHTQDIESMSSGTKDRSTIGHGIMFMHELGHTILGFIRRHDPKYGYRPGENVRRVNRMRRQLRLAKRRQYRTSSDEYDSKGEPVGQDAIPFSRKALRKLRTARAKVGTKEGKLNEETDGAYSKQDD